MVHNDFIYFRPHSSSYFPLCLFLLLFLCLLRYTLISSLFFSSFLLSFFIFLPLLWSSTSWHPLPLPVQVHGTDGSTKPMKGDQYLHFDPGSLSSTCKKTPKFRGELFMPHHKLQVHIALCSVFVCAAICVQQGRGECTFYQVLHSAVLYKQWEINWFYLFVTNVYSLPLTFITYPTFLFQTFSICTYLPFPSSPSYFL